jgi:hypothetical protein
MPAAVAAAAAAVRAGSHMQKIIMRHAALKSLSAVDVE